MPFFCGKPGPGLNLTDKQIKEVFREHDKNGDGKLSKAELAESFKKLGALFPGWRAKRAMSHADSDSNGVITPDEFEQLVNYVQSLGYTVQGLARN